MISDPLINLNNRKIYISWTLFLRMFHRPNENESIWPCSLTTSCGVSYLLSRFRGHANSLWNMMASTSRSNRTQKLNFFCVVFLLICQSICADGKKMKEVGCIHGKVGILLSRGSMVQKCIQTPGSYMHPAHVHWCRSFHSFREMNCIWGCQFSDRINHSRMN